MRAIDKGHDPRKLAEYRCKPGAVYYGPLLTWKKDKNDPGEKSIKDEIREQLLREQGYLCAYCMKRIDTAQMKVEHWHSQADDKYPNEQLDYQNLLGVCKGNEGQPLEKQTCDSRKGNQDLKYNPANSAHRIESQVRFLHDGEIESEDSEFDRQLGDVLNLKKDNNPLLAKNRKAVWDAVHHRLNQVPGSRTPAELQKLLAQWNKPDSEGRLREYCAVAVYYLRKRQAKVGKSA